MQAAVALSNHAETRQQQRGIPPLIVDWLLEYGATEHQVGGAVIHYFDKRAKRRLEQLCGRVVIARLTEFLDAYAITKDDTVLTLGRRYKRIRH